MKKINAFILYTEPEQTLKTVNELKKSNLIHQIYLLAPKSQRGIRNNNIEGCEIIEIDGIESSQTVKLIASKSIVDYTLIYIKPTMLKLGYFALERMVGIAEDTQAGMVYADYYTVISGEKKNHPVFDYQEGSLRDDFDFGSLLL